MLRGVRVRSSCPKFSCHQSDRYSARVDKMTTLSETTAVPPRIIVVLNEARRSMTRVFPRSAKAFTLIELLVVIIVLAGVLASLLPAMTKTNTAISTFQCLNNNRQ